jgi:hypothetical protein
MYLHTLSTSDLETENAEADSCHANIPLLSLFSLINFEELSATIVANISSEKLGDLETRK